MIQDLSGSRELLDLESPVVQGAGGLGSSDVALRGGATSSQDEYTQALGRTFLTLLLAIAFGLALIPLKGAQSSIEFFSGYVVEQR